MPLLFFEGQEDLSIPSRRGVDRTLDYDDCDLAPCRPAPPAMSQVQPILVNGEWIQSKSEKTFKAVNPATKEEHHIEFPVSPWEECDAACEAAYEASVQMRGWPGDRFGAYLDAFANRVEARAEELITTANLETAYPVVPRLQDVELPRTIDQLRQAADAAREGSWCNPVIDTASGIRAMLGPIGPVCVFGPNNFPFAFNGAAGGDFAAAVAAGNPVIAKGHSSHPRTTQIFAEEAFEAARETGMPKAMIRELWLPKPAPLLRAPV